MAKRVLSDNLSIIFGAFAVYLYLEAPSLEQSTRYLIIVSLSVILFANTVNLLTAITKSADLRFKLNVLSMFAATLLIIALGFERLWQIDRIRDDYPSDFSIDPRENFYFLITLISFVILFFSMLKVESALAKLLSIPILIVAMGANFLVFLIDLLFPPRIQELVPYIDAVRTLILNIASVMADPRRLEAEAALKNLGDTASAVEDIGEGYALRKSLGQGIDIGLTAVIFVGFGVLSALTNVISPAIVVIFFSSLGLALATFSGFFGPFYGLAGAAKEYSLRNGNYRGAAFYKTIEQIFAIPFLAASAGFLFLDLPPVDSQSLDDFKEEMNDQITELSDNLNSLLGRAGGAVPRKTQKLLDSLMSSTQQNLSKLDFRDMRQETAREFALSYYQHEFSWKSWKRKSAVEEFAKSNNFDMTTGEDTLRLIGYKIEAGQMDDDMVSNVMISAAMRGVIMMEQKHQEILEDLELGQTCTGLAFGARQFLRDHYIVRSRKRKVYDLFKNFIIGVFAIPAVLILGFHKYANRFFDFFGEAFWNQQILDLTRIRYREISTKVASTPSHLREKLKRTPSTKTEKKEKEKRDLKLGQRFKTLIGMIWKILIFPVTVIVGTIKWILRRIGGTDPTPREQFEEAIAHAALVAMYNELYNKLVMQDHVSSAF